MKQLAEALKITAEVTVQEWTRSMSTGKRGREEAKEKEEGFILTVNRRE